MSKQVVLEDRNAPKRRNIDHYFNRLGLAAINEKESACASIALVGCDRIDHRHITEDGRRVGFRVD